MLLNVLFLILGLFLHSAAAIILVVPVVMPLVQAVGIDPVQFGIIITINLGIGSRRRRGQRAHRGLLHREGRHLDVTKVNIWFNRGAAPRVDALDLRSRGASDARSPFLRRLRPT